MMASGLSCAGASARPNLLVIHCDELSYRTLGCYRAQMPKEQAYIWGEGVAVETPHIDSIAARGALCTRYFATSPVCTPSRASFVSGRYPQNGGAIANDIPMKDDVVTFAEVLRRAGYATGYAGKWHLDGEAKPGFTPGRQFGFEDNRYMFNRGHWKKLEDGPGGPRVAATDKKGNPTYDVAGADAKSFTTDFLADKAMAFIDANKDKPFCVMLSIPDPHGPNTVRAPYDTMFEGMAFQAPKTAARDPASAPAWGKPTAKKAGKSAGMAKYFGMVKCIDDNVGRMLEALETGGLRERTWIVFTADHGDLCGEHGRHDKGVPFDTSAGIPFLLAAPGKVKPGSVVGEALGTVDFKPTILALMGVGAPGGDEGRDASHLFSGGGEPEGWRDLTFMRIGGTGKGERGWMAAVTSRYKFVVSPGDGPWLFDREADPWELKNFSGDPGHRDAARMLATALGDYGARFHEPLMGAGGVAAALKSASE